MDRIKTLCSYLDKCKVFADVACDHAHVAEYMLKNHLCERAIVSDISKNSLKKAENLLKEFIDSGLCEAVCCDGLKGVFGADEVIIAGIGGEEILKIFKEGYIPEKFILQPMKNHREVREYLLAQGAYLSVDDIFSDGKYYYFVIKGERGARKVAGYGEREREYGRDSLKNPILYKYLEEELGKKKGYLSDDMSLTSRERIEREIKFIRDTIENGYK